MKVNNFTRETKNGTTKVSETITWENCVRDTAEVFWETSLEFQDDLVINPDSWLLAYTLVTMRYGEERLELDAPVSPEIKDGLNNAMRCLVD